MATRDISTRIDGSPSRHDVVLAVIPTAFIISVLIGQLLDIHPRVALGAASLIGALAVLDALFINPPKRGGREQADTV